MAPSSSSAPKSTLPLIPLAPPQAVLPGTTTRIPIANRADVAAILASIYSRATGPGSGDRDGDGVVLVGAVPLGAGVSGEGTSEGTTSGGTTSGGSGKKKSGSKEVKKAGGDGGERRDAAAAEKEDLFGYGTVVRVSGMHGQRQGELSLVVEGVSRFRIARIIQERPYFEAELVHLEDDFINPADAATQMLFAELKQCSRELLALVRLSSILPRSAAVSISPLMARRFELFIAKRDISQAGQLADFMANAVDCTHEEKLGVLAAVAVKDRLERVIELLKRQIGTLQGSGRILSIQPGRVPNLDPLGKYEQQIRRRFGGSMPGGMAGPPGMPGGNAAGGADGESELDELKRRLDEARLSVDAQKVANREFQRLGKMHPAQAEYQVCRNYLENLAEIPWSKVTEDHLDAQTLTRARKQLDEDHHGLEKIKKRLLEYLAVLKLKQGVNADLEAKIKELNKAEAPQEQKEMAEEEAEAGEVAEDQPSKAVSTIEKPREPSEAESRLLERKRMIDKSPILLLVGPPGTGKTSLAKSVATALGRKFHRISLGGVRDEAEIRGHRRTYVAAMPGLIVNGLKKVGVANPVFLLDEIDKLGMANYNGDPSAAMLEVLDPEQNHTFTDHYVSVPIDLSKVLFIATANSLDTISAPLLDRMETIQLSGYTTLEKRHIATKHLLPKQITTNGMDADTVQLPEDVLDKIITAYTREAGVRNLEREIGSVCRFKAVEYASATDRDSQRQSQPQPSTTTTTTTTTYTPLVTLPALETILGTPPFTEELADAHTRPGVVTGLVAYSTGAQGSILFIEILDTPGSGAVQLTGKLGDVLKESVLVALTWVKSHAYTLGLTPSATTDLMLQRSIHVHCPSGAIPKDGPSAGLAHTVALVSLFANLPVPPRLAMTGEVSLRGKVLPVGGVREKLLGALRAGVETVLLPEANRLDLKDLPDEVGKGLRIVCVGWIWEGLREVWPERGWRAVEGGWGVESRL